MAGAVIDFVRQTLLLLGAMCDPDKAILLAASFNGSVSAAKQAMYDSMHARQGPGGCQKLAAPPAYIVPSARPDPIPSSTHSNRTPFPPPLPAPTRPQDG